MAMGRGGYNGPEENNDSSRITTFPAELVSMQGRGGYNATIEFPSMQGRGGYNDVHDDDE
ncbi:hypothetical protein VTN00DRAFT_8669 [Thermoascus crustaceus]|uniref:uncharacterized protein n=1 Tax=Thermoascus crustaceus TaxID=5088 RepID=UPI003742DBE4